MTESRGNGAEIEPEAEDVRLDGVMQIAVQIGSIGFTARGPAEATLAAYTHWADWIGREMVRNRELAALSGVARGGMQ